MSKYSVLFSGRKEGAIGAFYRLTLTVESDSIHSGSIIAALRERGYETERLVCRTLLS